MISDLSGRELFLCLAVVGLIINAGVDLLTPRQNPTVIQVVDYEAVLLAAKTEFSETQPSREFVQLNLSKIMPYIQTAVNDVAAQTENVVILDKASVLKGDVLDVSDVVYALAMDRAKQNMGQDGIIRGVGQ